MAAWVAAIFFLAESGQGQDAGSDLELFRDSLGEVLWKSGKTLRFHSPAVRVGKAGRFVCLRPADSPRADPETIEIQNRILKTELLASEFKTGLCLLGPVDEPESHSEPDEAAQPAISIGNPSGWPGPGTVVLAIDSKAEPVLTGRIAGRDLIYQSRNLPVTLLRVNLDPKTAIDRALPLMDADRSALIGFLLPEPLENPGEYHAVPAVLVAKLIRDFETLEAAASGKLGASFDVGSTTPQIVSIREGSAADRAGLKKGDVILRIGDWKISRLSDVIEVLRTLTPKVSVRVEVLRGLETATIEVVPELVNSGGKP